MSCLPVHYVNVVVCIDYGPWVFCVPVHYVNVMVCIDYGPRQYAVRGGHEAEVDEMKQGPEGRGSVSFTYTTHVFALNLRLDRGGKYVLFFYWL